MSCPSRIFDPLGGQQPVFLGCSIVASNGISMRLGYNEDQSSMSITLVEDTCPPVSGVKVCYDLQTKAVLGADQDLTAHTFVTADPGFTFPEVGSPVYFRLGEHLEFNGIVQSYSENKSVSEYSIFNVNIVDPREILEGCQVIMGTYVGGVYGTPNVFNVYAVTETLGTQCGEAFLTDLTGPGRFGGSQYNEFGMPWNKVRAGLIYLSAGFPAASNNWCNGGRIKYRGYDYVLDISELPPVANYRFAADNLSIADILKEITTFLAMDYYVSLEFLMHEEEICRVIKVRTISRRQIPNLSSIDTFIGNSDGTIATEKGRELRNENTASILVGGPRSDLFVQVSNHQAVSVDQLYLENRCVVLTPDISLPGGDIPGANFETPVLKSGKPWHNMTIAPYWGLDAYGGVIIGQGLGMQHNFNIDVSYANLETKSRTNRLMWYNISVEEIHAAMAGKDLWLSYVAVTKPEIANQLGLDDVPFDFVNLLGGALINLINDKKKAAAKPQDLIKIRRDNIKAFDAWYNTIANRQRIQFNIDTLFRIVEHYGTTYYGRQFMVRMFDLDTNNNFVCVKTDPISGRVNYSKEVTDGGWTDYTQGFMGLQHIEHLDRFRTSDDRIQAFVRFNEAENIEMPDLGCDEFVFQELSNRNPFIPPEFDAVIFDLNQTPSYLQKTLYVKCQVEPDFVFRNIGCGRFDFSDPRVVITLPTILRRRSPELMDDIPYFLQFMYRAMGGIVDGDDFLQHPANTQAEIIRDLMKKAGGSDVHAGVDMMRLAPNAACIPLKSNVSTYGPWFANADGLQGKANYRVDESLVPWNYGDTVSMSSAATLLCTESLSIMQESERGSVEVPGLPALKLGDELESGGSSLTATRALLVTPEQVEDSSFTSARLETDGWTGVYGPNVTEIDIKISSDGITTSYNMRTYTPSFARNKYFAERIKNRGLLAQQNRRFNRGTFERRDDLRTFVTDITNQLIRERQEQKGLFTKSPHTVLVGQNLDYTIEEGEYNVEGEEQTFVRPVVQTQNLMESKAELVDYENKHYMSLEGLLRPVTIDWNVPLDFGQSTHGAAPSYPPVQGSKDSNLKWDRFTLNPFLNIGAKSPSVPLGGNDCGHDMEYLARDAELQGDLNIRAQDEYGLTYRVFGLRGPMILSAWGADINGKPVPNEADDPNFEGEGKTDKFLSNWLRRSNMWKTGPVDLRWDENREVWTSPPGYSLVQARACTNMTHEFGSSGTAVLINYPEEAIPPPDEDAEEEADGDCPGPKINIINTTSYPIRRGANLLCYYYVQNDEYWVLEAPAPLYSVYIPDNITPANSTASHYSGIGYLYDNLMHNFNDHIECPTGSITVLTLGLPIRGGTEAICVERKLNEFWILKSQARPLCLVTDVNCEQAYTPNGTTSALEVCDTTIWLEGNYLKENCGDTTVGGCNTNPADNDFVGS